MTTLSIAGRRGARSSVDPPLDWRVMAVWTALFLNVLPFTGIPIVTPIPTPVGQLIAQGALPMALLLALVANPRGLMRPNVFVVAFSLLALLALMVSLHNHFMLGSVYRAGRFAGFMAVLWLLSPYWGRGDLMLLRVHRLCLLVVVASVAVGAVVAPGLAFSFQGRLSGVLWPVFPTQAAHYAAVLLGTTVVLWMCRVIGGRNAALVVAVAVAVMILTHTRTALFAGTAGLVCASASLLLARSRARRAWLWGGLLGAAALVAFASEVTSWLLRGQDSEQVAGLTGRTAVWEAVLEHPRPLVQELFGSGMSNLSYNGNPIDSNWVGTYLDLGLLGVTIEVGILLVLLLTALTRSSGPGRAIAIFLVVYCIFSSITETGMSGPSAYLLDLAVASASLVRSPPGQPR
jgi:hypothetical protein